MEIKKDFRYFLFLDGDIAFNIAVYNRFSGVGDNSYFEVCGGFIEGVYQWATHNIVAVVESCNDKYTGWTLTFDNGTEKRVYIPNSVLAVAPKNWRHAKNIFNKYLRAV